MSNNSGNESIKPVRLNLHSDVVNNKRNPPSVTPKGEPYAVPSSEPKADPNPGPKSEQSDPIGQNNKRFTAATYSSGSSGMKRDRPQGLSRSHSFREPTKTSGVSFLKELDITPLPLFEITPISAGDFNLPGPSLTEDSFVTFNEPPQTSLTDAISKLGIEALPNPPPPNRNTFSSVLSEYGFNVEPPTAQPTPSIVPQGDQLPAAPSASKLKQRAKSEPAGPRKPLALSENTTFSEHLAQMTQLQEQAGAFTGGSEIRGHGFEDKFKEQATTSILPAIVSEYEQLVTKAEAPVNELGSLQDNETLLLGEHLHQSRDRNKKSKHRSEALPELVPMLTAHMELQVSSTDKNATTTSTEGVCPARTSNTNIRNIEADRKKSPTSPKKSQDPSKGCSGKSPKGTPLPESSPKTKVDRSRGKEPEDTTPPRPKLLGPCPPTSPKTTKTSEEPKDKTPPPKVRPEVKFIPTREKTNPCNVKFTQPCRKGRLYGKCCTAKFTGGFFNSLSSAFGCQLNCIANRNRLYNFPGMSGLYQPDIGFTSNPPDEYEICDDDEDDDEYDDYQKRRSPTTQKDSRAGSKGHGTPAFYNSRAQSLEGFRSSRSSGRSGKGQHSKRFKSATSASDQRYTGRTKQRTSSTKRSTAAASQSSETSNGDQMPESDQSVEDVEDFSPQRSNKARSSGKNSALSEKDSHLSRRSSRLTPGGKQSGDNSFPESDEENQTKRLSQMSTRISSARDSETGLSPTKTQSKSGSNKLETDSRESMTKSEREFIDQTKKSLESLNSRTRSRSRDARESLRESSCKVSGRRSSTDRNQQESERRLSSLQQPSDSRRSTPLSRQAESDRRSSTLQSTPLTQENDYERRSSFTPREPSDSRRSTPLSRQVESDRRSSTLQSTPLTQENDYERRSSFTSRDIEPERQSSLLPPKRDSERRSSQQPRELESDRRSSQASRDNESKRRSSLPSRESETERRSSVTSRDYESERRSSVSSHRRHSVASQDAASTDRCSGSRSRPSEETVIKRKVDDTSQSDILSTLSSRERRHSLSGSGRRTPPQSVSNRICGSGLRSRDRSQESLGGVEDRGSSRSERCEDLLRRQAQEPEHDLCCTGGAVGDVAITVKCDQGSEKKSPSCIQVCASMGSTGNVVVLNVGECPFTMQPETTDTESSFAAQKEVMPSLEPAPCLRQTGDGFRCADRAQTPTQEICCARTRCLTPCETTMKGRSSETIRSQLSANRSVGELSTERRGSGRNEISDLAIANRASLLRSASSLHPRVDVDSERRKSNQASASFYESRKPDVTDYRYRDKDDLLSISRTSQKGDTNRSFASTEEISSRRVIARPEDTSNQDSQNDNFGGHLGIREEALKRGDRILFECEPSQPKTDETGSLREPPNWNDKRKCERPTSSASSKQSSAPDSECSSTEMTGTSCGEEQRKRRSSKLLVDEDTQSTRSMMESTRSSMRKSQRDYTQHLQSLIDQEELRETTPRSQQGDSLSYRSRSHLKQGSRHTGDSTCDEDDNEIVSHNDLSTSASRRTPAEGVSGEFDKRSESVSYRKSRGEGFDNGRAEGCGDSISFRSLREHSRHSQHFEDKLSHSDRGAIGSSQRGHIPYPASGNQPKSSCAVVSNTSRSSHSPTSRGSETDAGDSSVQDSRPDLIAAKHSSREVEQLVRKSYTHTDTLPSRSTTMERSTSDETSESTLPASPGGLDSEYNDEEGEERHHKGKHRARQVLAGTGEKKSRRRETPRLPESHDESHNSSSCRSSPVLVQARNTRCMLQEFPNGDGIIVVHGDGDRPHFSAISHNTVAVIRETQDAGSFRTDIGTDRRRLAFRSDPNDNDPNTDSLRSISYVRQVERGEAETQLTTIRNRSPKFHRVANLKPQLMDEADQSEQTSQTRSHSNSTSCTQRARIYAESTIDLFEQIITPEQPLQVKERRTVQSLQNAQPFYCTSVRSTIQKATTHARSSSARGSLRSENDNSGAELCCIQERTVVESQTFSQANHPLLNSNQVYLRSPAVPSVSGRYQFQRVTNFVPNAASNLSTNRRSRTQSATFAVPPSSGSPLPIEAPSSLPFPESMRGHLVQFRNTPCPTLQYEVYEDDLPVATEVVPWDGNKNFSSSAEGDRNSSSGHGDIWYPEYAYRCGVVDTLRLIDTDYAMSTPSGESDQPSQERESECNPHSEQREIEDHLSYIIRSAPALALGKNGDETFEVIRQNSLRALLYAAKLSVDWPPFGSSDKDVDCNGAIGNVSFSSNVSSLENVSCWSVKSRSVQARSPQRISFEQDHETMTRATLQEYSVYTIDSPGVAAVHAEEEEDKDICQSSTRGVQEKSVGALVQDTESVSSDISESITTNSDSEASDKSEPENSPGNVNREDVEDSDQSDSLQDPGARTQSRQSSPRKNSILLSCTQSALPAEGAPSISSLSEKQSVSPSKIIVHKAELSSVEEDRLRTAVSKKLGSHKHFTLVPVSIDDSVHIIDTGQCRRLSPARKPQHVPDESFMLRKPGQGRADTGNYRESSEGIVEIGLSSPEKTKTFYVLAPDQAPGIDHCTGSPQIVLNPTQGESPGADRGKTEGTPRRKYFIFTRDELMDTISRKVSLDEQSHNCMNINQCRESQTQLVDKSVIEEEQYSPIISQQAYRELAQRTFVIEEGLHDRSLWETKSEPNASPRTRRQEDTHFTGNCFLYNNMQVKKRSSSALANTTSPAKSAEFNLDLRYRLGDNVNHIVVTNKEFESRHEKLGRQQDPQEYNTGDSPPGECFYLNQASDSKNTTKSPGALQKRSPIFRIEQGERRLDKAPKDCLSEILPTKKSPVFQKCCISPDIKTVSSDKEDLKGNVNANLSGDSSMNISKNMIPVHGYLQEPGEDIAKMKERNTSTTSSFNKFGNNLEWHSPPARSYSDAGVTLATPGQGTISSQQRGCLVSEDRVPLRVLETLLNEKLPVLFEKAMEKMKSPKSKQVSWPTKKLENAQIRLKTEATSRCPSSAVRDYAYSRSSDAGSTSTQSLPSPTDTIMEKSLTDESDIRSMFKLPKDTLRQKMSLELTKQQNEQLLSWISDQGSRQAKKKPKSFKTREKYVLSIKRKRVISDSAAGPKTRLIHKMPLSSESENITNSANDVYDTPAPDTCHEPKISMHDCQWDIPVYKRRTSSVGSPHRCCHRSPRRTSPGAGRPSSRRCCRHKHATEKPTRSLSLPRQKRRKKRAHSAPRQSRPKRTASQKVTVTQKFPRAVSATGGKEVGGGCVVPSSSGQRNLKTFSNSGISRLARSLHYGYKPDNYEQCGEQDHVLSFDSKRWSFPEPIECNAKKFDIREEISHWTNHQRMLGTDEDSFTGCEGLDSSLLTPIKEESHSHGTSTSDKSKSDFETFVNDFRQKMMKITDNSCDWQNGGNSRPVRGLPNSCSNSSFHTNSFKFGGRSFHEDSDSGDKQTSYWNAKNQYESTRPRYSAVSNLGTGLSKNNSKLCHDYSFSAMECSLPFKSSFLRKEIQHDAFGERTPHKNEDDLLRMYSSTRQNSNPHRYSCSTPSWSAREAHASWNYGRANSKDKTFLSSVTPTFAGSVPRVTSLSRLGHPGVSASQCCIEPTIGSSFRSDYHQGLSSANKNYADPTSLKSASRTLVTDECRSYARTGSRYYPADSFEMALNNQDLIRKNWNESANNGSDKSSSEDSNDEKETRSVSDPRSENVKVNQSKSKLKMVGTAGEASKDRCEGEKITRQGRLLRLPQDQCYGGPQVLAMDESHFLCCDHARLPYDYVHQNYSSSRVSNLAARNINASGNMFGGDTHPSTSDRMSIMQERECESDDEFTSATEDLPHYSNCKKRQSFLRKNKEMDDTCNHPDSRGYYMGDGPAGHFDNFEGVPKDELLISLSPMEDEEQLMYCCHRPKDLACPRSSSNMVHSSSLGGSKSARNECELHGSCDVDKSHSMNSRSCYGQGDILNKRMFTQWYVEDSDMCPQGTRRSNVNVTGHEMCPHKELWITPTENCDSSGDEDAEEDEDGEVDHCEDDDEEGEENNGDEEEEEVEEIDDEIEEEEEDDDEDEDEAEEEEEEEEDDRCEIITQGSLDDRYLLKQNETRPDLSDHILHNGLAPERPQDMNESKMMGKRSGGEADISANKRPNRRRLINSTKRYVSGQKHDHQQSNGDHLSRQSKPPVPGDKNSQLKPAGSHQPKFSLEQIKVPAIEKERVRFACDENGDWAEIGRGSYGCVYLGLLDGTIEVAIKDFYESSSWDLVIHEARMLMFLQDTGITPKFYGLRRRFDASKQPSEYCIIMEYFGDGRTLFNVMSDKIVLAGDEWMDIVGQLVAGLRLIHRKNVLINDLKADNILIDLTGGRKIIRYIDVGMATYKQGLTFQLPQDQMSKYNFLAPEVREGARTTTRSDIYSLGYMLEQLCRMADSSLGGLKKLVTRCMEKNPARRPDIDDIVSQVHRFIASKASILLNNSSPKQPYVLTNSV